MKRRIFTLLIAVLTMAAFAVPASASEYNPVEATIEFNETNPNLYWDGTEVSFRVDNDDEIFAILFQPVRFSNAQKIVSLAERLEPALALQSELKNLRACCNANLVRYGKLFPEQTDALDSHLIEQETLSALNALSCSSAREMVLAIKTLPEYQNDPFVTDFVDRYLDEDSSATNLVREALKALITDQGILGGPASEYSSVDEMNADELLEFSTAIVESDAFAALTEALSPVVISQNKNVVVLKATMTDEEIDQVWETLRDAASVYQPSYVYWLDNFEFLRPHGTLGYPVAGIVAETVTSDYPVTTK